MKSDAKFFKNSDLFFQKWEEFWILTWSLEICKISILIGSFSAKNITRLT